MIVEIGPHSALKGPIKQILTAGGLQQNAFIYGSALVRKVSAVQASLALAGEMFKMGAEVNVDVANFGKIQQRPQCLTTLPSYPWDHSTSYWHETRLSRNYRQRQDPPHPLLGVLTPDSSIFDMRWRKYIRVSEMPWLAGHVVNGRVIYPGAAFPCMASEASML